MQAKDKTTTNPHSSSLPGEKSGRRAPRRLGSVGGGKGVLVRKGMKEKIG